ncbi:hypothetical protein ISN76_10205 [Dyella halodurans]|uniref:Uncharacterized protein n=1 Tax=Dyella halodurans TaxID=1920171 RepID=A0ABV9C2K7_9GAMM|nr:hypothetical protein [Dyella halodurans]
MRPRQRLSWVYDDHRQEFTTPAGRVISLHEIAAMMQDQLICHHDFQGAWIGWRMRQNRLIPPSANFRSSQITPNTLRAFNRWLASFDGYQYQLSPDTSQLEQAGQPQTETTSRSRTQSEADPPQAAPSVAQSQQHEPRRRAEVIELAAYRQRARAR